ncbi:MAG: threonine synthase [Pseudomonadota bacterium]
MTHSFVSHLECSLTGETYAKGEVHGLSRAGRPLLVRYDLPRLREALDRADWEAREGGFWRYHELLPVADPDNRISLGEVMTPLIALSQAKKKHSLTGTLIVKDEGRLPTGSFKARGLALAVSMARELGLANLAIPTNGNAGAAMAAYATRAGLKSTVFCPDDTPAINVEEIALQGADVYRVNGLINDCGKLVGEGKAATGWFDVSTLKEPYRIEGKKTMGLELAQQFGWRLPDVIFYPTGGGTGLIGMWKAFDELEALGFIDSHRPRMVAVQATGCAPIVKAYEAGEEHAPLWEEAHTFAAGIRVPIAVGDFLILRAVRASGGFAMAVPDDAIHEAWTRVGREEGVLLCPEGAATYVAWQEALARGLVDRSDHCVLFICASGLKYPMPAVTASVDRLAPVDYEQFH